jgi:hypothetical protein
MLYEPMMKHELGTCTVKYCDYKELTSVNLLFQNTSITFSIKQQKIFTALHN